ncbi:unnamed protein product [Didymodactylos carnosus]|uniref:G-protein coupled receptors family 1 profile domain-containing protein n=2 Tax=Didymodactylos carnosus TaxID=1234261 RepID=A0A814E007_9BILA|nr:unnamed protein product [Didymodactylos carnosus]CAF3737970.1 unnamed protein product [Didymodactylos carnosus]
MAVYCIISGLFLFILGLFGNILCIIVFLRSKLRSRLVTPYFIVLLLADSIHFSFRLIKLFYYQKHFFNNSSCSFNFIIDLFNLVTKKLYIILIPFIHFETYIRFSLILMAFFSVQRYINIRQSIIKLKIVSSKYWSYILILIAFILAYLCELFSLTLFCSKENNRQLSYKLFMYTIQHLNEQYTKLLTFAMLNNSIHYHCTLYHIENIKSNFTITSKHICTNDQLLDILAYYFNLYEFSIVKLIQIIHYHQYGQKIHRNEIHFIYQTHKCLMKQESDWFLKYYNFLYNSKIGLNRYTLLLVFGNILPSVITIIGNILCAKHIITFKNKSFLSMLSNRRRTDENRRVLIIITIECLLAILNSWLIDVLLSIFYCKTNLFIGNDCPLFIRKYYALTTILDFFNSITNIFLHGICSKIFRQELRILLCCQTVNKLKNKYLNSNKCMTSKVSSYLLQYPTKLVPYEHNLTQVMMKNWSLTTQILIKYQINQLKGSWV